MQKEQKKERKRVKEIKSGWGEERKGTAVREIRRRKGREERKERKKGEERQRKRNKGERKQNRVTRKREGEGKGKEKRRKENQEGRRSSPREVILQVYGVHVCSGSAYASAGRQGSWLERKERKKPCHLGRSQAD